MKLKINYYLACKYLSMQGDVLYYKMLNAGLIDLDSDNGIDIFFDNLWELVNDELVSGFDVDLFLNMNPKLLNSYLAGISNWTIKKFDEDLKQLRLKRISFELEFEKKIRLKKENKKKDLFESKVFLNLKNKKKPSVIYLVKYLECYKKGFIKENMDIFKNEINSTLNFKEDLKRSIFDENSVNNSLNIYEQTSKYEYKYTNNIGLMVLKPNLDKEYYILQYNLFFKWLNDYSNYASNLLIYSLDELWNNCFIIGKKKKLSLKKLENFWWYNFIFVLSKLSNKNLNDILILIFNKRFNFLDLNLLKINAQQ